MGNAATVSVFGPGALGSALIDFTLNHTDEFRLHSVWGRSKSECYLYSGTEKILAKKLFPQEENGLGELIFLTVPDDQIELIADRLSKLSLNWENRSVAHFSGSHSSDLLQPLSAKGSAVASMHPLQTFTNGDTSSRFKDIWFTLEGDEQIFPLLERFIKAAGAKSKKMNTDQKKAMHLAAVFASNYLVSLMSAVEKISSESGIENGIEMMQPLMRQSLDNILSKGVDNSLSGPILRGDKSTIKSHLNLMGSQPGLRELYKQLGIQALQIAEKSGRLDEKDSKSIRKILSGK